MNKENISLDERIIHLEKKVEHQGEIIIKLLKEIQSHIWTKEGKKPTPVSLNDIALQETQATNYVNNVVLPKLQKRERDKEEGLMEAESWGAFLTPIWNYIKQEAITYIGQTLKELAIQGAVEASKWLIEQGEKTLLNLYNSASEEEKKLFKDKIQEVFPGSELLKKLEKK
jgi:hypothetical protein